MNKDSSKLKVKSVNFDGDVNDCFIILMNQSTGEFVLIHNNLTDCKCLLCKGILKGLVNLSNE